MEMNRRNARAPINRIYNMEELLVTDVINDIHDQIIFHVLFLFYVTATILMIFGNFPHVLFNFVLSGLGIRAA